MRQQLVVVAAVAVAAAAAESTTLQDCTIYTHVSAQKALLNIPFEIIFKLKA